MRSLQTSGRIIRRRSFFLLIPFVFILALVFASCGSNGGTGAGSSTPTAAPQTPVATSAGTSEGCPSTATISGIPSKPDVTIVATTSDTVIAHNGNLIEVRLPFGQRWSGPTTSQGVLQLQQPAGYAYQTEKVCIWHFIAQGTGMQTLAFSGHAICQKGQLCPMYVLSRQFTVDVK